MKTVITLLLALMITSYAGAQEKKDTVKQEPLTFLLAGPQQNFDYLVQVLVQSPLAIAGKALTYADTQELIKWIGSARKLEVPPPAQGPSTPQKSSPAKKD